eukprot:3500722-Rhodomonas_salina.2
MEIRVGIQRLVHPELKDKKTLTWSAWLAVNFGERLRGGWRAGLGAADASSYRRAHGRGVGQYGRLGTSASSFLDSAAAEPRAGRTVQNVSAGHPHPSARTHDVSTLLKHKLGDPPRTYALLLVKRART